MPRPAFRPLALALSLVGLLAACEEDIPTRRAPRVSPLLPGEAVAVSGGQGSLQYYGITVPDSASGLWVTLTGGTGDADLYMRWRDVPVNGAIDCFSVSATGDEDCYIHDPAPGDWFLAIVGFSAFDNVTLTARLTASPEATALTSGVSLTNLGGPEGSTRRYRIDVPPGATMLQVQSVSGTGNPDLFVSFERGGAIYATCASANAGPTESCLVENPSAGVWYVIVEGTTEYAGLTLTATVTVPPTGRTP